MRSSRLSGWALVGLCWIGWGPGASGLVAQARLEQAVEQIRARWLVHDAAGLVGASDTLRLQLPGGGLVAGLVPGQAGRLLERYWAGTREVALELGSVRAAGSGAGYAEVVRRYVVQGTAEERQESVYLGFRFVGGRWRLVEVRVVP